MNFTRDITMGRYFPTGSPLHRLDPRFKLSALVLLSIAILVQDNKNAYLLLGALLFGLILISRVHPLYYLKNLKSLRWLLIFTFLLHILTTTGKEVRLGNYIIPFITDKGLINGLEVVVKLCLLVLFTAVLTFTTSPLELTRGFEAMLRPFAIFGLNCHEVAMIMMISLRFIPFLLLECDKLIKCQVARGAVFGEGNLFARTKNLLPVFIPLFMNSIRRADELALAMESRGYHGAVGRTNFYQCRISAYDLLAAGFIAIIFVVMFFLP